MDEKQLKYQFMTILSESHPGLTFEEYRDSCIFLLFYQYLCLKYDDILDESYKLHMMVRMAIRGKLQMDSFLKFIGNASPFLHLVCPHFILTNMTFYKQLLEIETQEKQKSFARFFRKLIKKIDEWSVADQELLFECYPVCFESLIQEFASLKKDTGVPQDILSLYELFSGEESSKEERTVFQPEFRYGSLLRTLLKDCKKPMLCGYEKKQEYIEYMSIICFMNDIPWENQFFSTKKQWIDEKKFLGTVDTTCIYMPDGVEAGEYLSSEDANKKMKKLFSLRAKGELPFLLSAFPVLKEEGDILAIMPSAILYREGKEAQIRKYLVETLNCLDSIILLPDSVFPSLGQQEVFLYIKKNREKEDIMFFDCSNVDNFNEDILKDIKKAWRGRKTVSGFCNSIEKEEIAKNEYNLNLPRYIKQPVGLEAIDINEKRKRIAEIEQELKEIDQRIEMYRRDLELDAMIH